jgi:hypothetical protein
MAAPSGPLARTGLDRILQKERAAGNNGGPPTVEPCTYWLYQHDSDAAAWKRSDAALNFVSAAPLRFFVSVSLFSGRSTTYAHPGTTNDLPAAGS